MPSPRSIRLCRRALTALFLTVLPGAAAWAADLYRFAPPAAWIGQQTPDYTAPEPQGSTANGTYFLVVDRQSNITDIGDDSYAHIATRVSSEAAVSDESSISLQVDPLYQTIDLHFLRIIRAGKAIDARKDARITALPEETQLQARVYNGSYNIDILLADVRIGDVVEYAYTMHSRGMLYRGHFGASMPVAWKVPVHWQRTRFRAPRDRPLRALMSDGSPTPAFAIEGNIQELDLIQKDVVPIQSEDDTPSWYSPWPYLQVSDFKDWAQVARETEAFYTRVLQPTPEIREIARQIAAAGGEPEEIALRALQYVQENIRYVSIAIGHGAYQPTVPSKVVQRRYGDCKDKSVLLVSLLRELGIEAQPALVHTRRGRRLPNILPTPFSFDHVIVRMHIGGKTYWADGTRVKQYAALSTDASPDYEHALLLAPGTDALTAIPRPGSNTRPKEISVTLNLSKGTDKPGLLTVVTRYRGGLADDMRPALASSSLEQRRADYLDYTSRYYPGAKSAGPVQIRDDKERDILEVTEKYTLESVFSDNEEDRSELVLHADELYRYAEPMSWNERRAPLALDYPLSVRQQVSVLLPDDWPVKPEKKRILNPAFRFESDVRYSARTLELIYEYEALKDEVSPAELKKYLADRRRFDDDLGYSLSQDKPGSLSSVKESAGLAPVPLLTLICSFALSAWLAVRFLYRWDPVPPEPPAGAKAGIAGWLILPAIGVCIAPLVTASVIVEWLPFINAAMWDALPTVVSEPTRSTAKFAMLAMVACAAPLLATSIVLTALFFRRRSSAPLIFIALIGINAVYDIAAYGWMMAAELNDEGDAGVSLRELIRGLSYAVVWSLYMLQSKRVKATFQRRLREPAPAAENAVAAV